MDIEYSAAHPAAILNKASGEVYPLDGKTPAPRGLIVRESKLSGPTAQMFAFLDGELREQTDDGGMGFIPDDCGFLQCGVLCIDTRRPKIPVTATAGDGGPRCIVMARKGRIDTESPAVVVHESEQRGIEVYFGPTYGTSIYQMLHRPQDIRASTNGGYRLGLRVYGLFGEDDKTICKRILKMTLYNAPVEKIGLLSRQRILELIFWDRLYTPGAARRQKPWEWGLGVSTAVDGDLYYSVGGILRRPVPKPYDWQRQFAGVTFVVDPRPGFTEGDLYLAKRQSRPWQLYGKYPLRRGGGDKRFTVSVTQHDVTTMMHLGQLPPHLQQKILPPPTS